MKWAVPIALILSMPFAGLAADIPKGTHVLLRMVNSINTRTAEEGNQVYLQTASPIAVNGQILVPTGAYVQGVVSRSKHSGRVSGRAELGIRIETLTLPSGKTFRVSPRLAAVDSNETDQKVENVENTVKQGSDYSKDAQRVAILAGSGAGLGGLTDRSWKGAGIGAGAGSAVGIATVLLTRGREVELKQGTTLDVVFDRPIALE